MQAPAPGDGHHTGRHDERSRYPAGPVLPDQDPGRGPGLLRRRRRPHPPRPRRLHLYTPPGGNVEDSEDLEEALARELSEELDLDVAQAEGGDLTWVVDQRVTRPGPPRSGPVHHHASPYALPLCTPYALRTPGRRGEEGRVR
ncbi:NUDIX domain-containing protein [Streptomyces laurentii]|uniref:NUDIX domain-containing protein n=1 Tax=Streptomyces laurentii TaxID=39478 RepID=UPI0036878A86